VPDERAAALAALAVEIEACRACPLGSQRTQSVPGEGSPHAELLLVGEAPGAHEDAAGRPFVGAAGKLLDLLLNLIGLQRPQVYVLNVVKCRPPENRDPEPTEIAACSGFLERQLALLQPVIIAPLGRHALRAFAPEGETRQTPVGTTLFPLYHPAAALHNGALRPTLERDMGALSRALPAARSAWRVARGGAGEASLSEIEAAAERDQLRLFESEAQ